MDWTFPFGTFLRSLGNLVAGFLGQWISWETFVATGFHPTESGTIVVLMVLLFFLSMVIGPSLRERGPRSLVKPESLSREPLASA